MADQTSLLFKTCVFLTGLVTYSMGYGMMEFDRDTYFQSEFWLHFGMAVLPFALLCVNFWVEVHPKDNQIQNVVCTAVSFLSYVHSHIFVISKLSLLKECFNSNSDSPSCSNVYIPESIFPSLRFALTTMGGFYYCIFSVICLYGFKNQPKIIEKKQK